MFLGIYRIPQEGSRISACHQIREDKMQNYVQPNIKLNVDSAASMLNVSKSWLNKARLEGNGPPFLKIGRRVLYDPQDVIIWLETRKFNSTSSYP